MFPLNSWIVLLMFNTLRFFQIINLDPTWLTGWFLYLKASNVSLLTIPCIVIPCQLMKTTKVMRYGRNGIFIHGKF